MRQSYDAATGEDARLNDVLKSQDAITSKYSTYGAQLSSPDIRHDMSLILDDEREILSDLFGAMQRRGLKESERARRDEIDEMARRFK